MNLVGQLLVKLIMTLLVGKDLCPKLSKLVKLEMAFSLSRQNWIGSPLPRDDEALDGGQVFFQTEAEKFLFHFMLLSSEI